MAAMTASFDGLLLIQLGTPASASPAAVGKYLLEFLGDPHTLGNPPFFWKPLLRFGIVPLRLRSSAAKYRAMLALSHSSEMPLLTHTKAFARGVAEKIGTRMTVSFAFQYGTGPSISEALGAFAEQGLKNLCVIPLYPQRSSATGGAAAALVRDAAENFPDISLHFVDGFARSDAWARNVADSIYGKWNEKDDIVLSWHGLPESRILAGDPYRADCEAAAAPQRHGRGHLRNTVYKIRRAVQRVDDPAVSIRLAQVFRAFFRHEGRRGGQRCQGALQAGLHRHVRFRDQINAALVAHMAGAAPCLAHNSAACQHHLRQTAQFRIHQLIN